MASGKKPVAELFSDLVLLVDLPKRIGIGWDNLLIRLGLTKSNIDHLESDYRFLTDKIKNGLNMWNTENKHMPYRERANKLTEALKDEDMRGLAEELEDAYNLEDPANTMPNITEEFRELSDDIHSEKTTEASEYTGNKAIRTQETKIMLTIADITKIEPDSKETPAYSRLKAVVLDVSPIEKAEKLRSRFYVVLADETGSITATCYAKGQHQKFIKGQAVVLMNVLLKQSYIVITSRSEVAMAKGFAISEEIRLEAPKLPGSESVDLATAMSLPVKSLTTVKGKVIKVRPATTKEVQGKNLPFQDLVIKDHSRKVTLAVWKDMVNSIEKGSVIKMSKCRMCLFYGEKKLSTTPGSSLEIMLTIADITKFKPDTQELPAYSSLEAVVLDVSPIEKTEKLRSRFYVVLADETGSITATCYAEGQHQKFVKGQAVVLMNVLLKQSCIVITSRSEVATAKGFDISEEIRLKAPKLPGSESVDLATAMSLPEKSLTTVKGKVIKVWPATTNGVKGEHVPFQDLVIKDHSRKVTLAVWKDMVNSIEKGSVIKMSKCRVRLFDGEKKLSTTPGSSLEIVQDDKLEEMSSDNEDDLDDESGSSLMTSGTIEVVVDVNPYFSCPKPACKNERLFTVEDNGVY